MKFTPTMPGGVPDRQGHEIKPSQCTKCFSIRHGIDIRTLNGNWPFDNKPQFKSAGLSFVGRLCSIAHSPESAMSRTNDLNGSRWESANLKPP